MAVIRFMTRFPCALANAILACGVLTVGIGIVVAAGYYNTDRFLNSPGELRKYSDRIVTAMMVAGLLCICVSLLGCATIKIESRILPRVYGIFLIPAFIICLVCTISFG